MFVKDYRLAKFLKSGQFSSMSKYDVDYKIVMAECNQKTVNRYFFSLN